MAAETFDLARDSHTLHRRMAYMARISTQRRSRGLPAFLAAPGNRLSLYELYLFGE
jgi:hypothetical protein